MNEVAYERVVVALTLQGWREMLANRNARVNIIKTLCPGLTVGDTLEQHVVGLLTEDHLHTDASSSSFSASAQEAISA